MNGRPRLYASGQRGFSLVELLVGILIALLGVLVMMQALLNFEERGRTTGDGNEALSNGAVMLHVLSRDLQQAGYGLNSLSLLGCQLLLPTGATLTIAPAQINPGAGVLPAQDADTDALLVMSGNSETQPEGNPVIGVSGSDYTVQAASAFAANDYVIAAPDTCSGALRLTKVTATSGTQVTVDTVVPGATVLFNLGPAPRISGYLVRNGTLVSCDFLKQDCRTYSAITWPALSDNIPSLRAVYGRDTTAPSMDGSADTWDQSPPASACGWARAVALRVVVVARSSKYESAVNPATGQRACEVVTSTAPGWRGAAAAPVVLSESDWQCYRYRPFETLAPARNVIWMEGQSQC